MTMPNFVISGGPEVEKAEMRVRLQLDSYTNFEFNDTVVSMMGLSFMV